MERNVLVDQAFDFLNKNQIFYKYQSCFRYYYLIDRFVSILNGIIIKDFVDGLHSEIILINLQKMLDATGHLLMSIHFRKHSELV